MYDGKSQLLIKNPLDRYLINWLPAPNDLVYLVMRLYWPKETPPSILPPGEGTWKPPGLVKVK